jgi:hypothetical protein
MERDTDSLGNSRGPNKGAESEARWATYELPPPDDPVSADFSRREFLRTVGTTAAAVAVAGSGAPVLAAPVVDRHALIAALGDTLIPSDSGDRGYKDLEPYKITEEVLKALPGVDDADLGLFNERTKGTFGGKTFLELGEPQRAQYLRQIIDGSSVADPTELKTLQGVYHASRKRVLTVYYSNFPEDKWPHDANGMPVLKPGDTHQITNPNTKDIVTAWDQIGFLGPLTWEEEERRRNLVKKLNIDWHENWSPFDYHPEKL